MQDITSGVCTHSTANNDKVYNLIDRRINYTSNKMFSYRVKKLTDGHCWMNQNLAIEGQTTLSSTYSNLPHSNVANNYTLPVSDPVNNWSISTTESKMTNSTHIDNAVDVLGTNTGAFYNWLTTTAGTGASLSTHYQNTTYDICPAGWRLPTAYTNAGADGELTNILNNKSAFLSKWNYGRVGYYENYYVESSTGIVAENKSDVYWSSTCGKDNLSAYYMWQGSDDFIHIYGDNRRAVGASIRCIAK